MKKYTIILQILLIFLFLSNSFGQGLDSTSIKPLNNIKYVEAENFSILQQKIYEDFRKLRPNFLTEFKLEVFVPLGKESEIVDELVAKLTDFSSYNKIPYYSRRLQKYFDFFVDVIPSNTFNDDWIEILHLQMRPFEPGHMSFSMESGRNGILFKCTNSESLKLGIFQAAGKEKMKISLSVEQSPGKITFYGLGGAKAFGGIGKSMVDRMNDAFNGRIESFFIWINSNFEEILTQYED